LSLDLRYEGQAFEIGIPLEKDHLTRFHAEHDRLYGHSDPSAPVEIVNLRLRAVGRMEMPDFQPLAEHVEASTPPELDRRAVVVGLTPASLDGEAAGLKVRETPVYEHARLRPGHQFSGPAVVISEDTTVWLGPTERAAVDEYVNLLIDVGRGRDAGVEL
jgi:N-methylhydantoinase A